MDIETGHVLSTKQRKLKMFLFSDRGFMFQNNRRMLKTFPTIAWPELSHSELGQLMLLGRLMEDGNLIPLTTAEMAVVLSKSVNRTYAFIRKMITRGVMKRSGRNLYINPLFLFVGKFMNHHLYFLFQDSLDRYLPEWARNQFKE